MLSLIRRVKVHHTHGWAVYHVFILSVSLLYLHISHNFRYSNSALSGQTSNEFYEMITHKHEYKSVSNIKVTVLSHVEQAFHHFPK